jgi:small subunit ribosomal protein S17
VISVERQIMHRRYKKYIRRRKKYKAHDEANASHVGDRVLIVESRPLSREKRWRIRTILEKAR